MYPPRSMEGLGQFHRDLSPLVGNSPNGSLGYGNPPNMLGSFRLRSNYGNLPRKVILFSGWEITIGSPTKTRCIVIPGPSRSTSES